MPKELDTKTPFNGQSLVGKVYFRITVKSYAGKWKTPAGSVYYYWNCLCVCLTETVVSSNDLTSGKVRSCGCWKSEVTSKRNTTHGKCDHHLYSTWAGMIQRCRDENQRAYKYYGGKGVRVCKRWKDFKFFLEDMESTWMPGLTLDRQDYDKGYNPTNVKWGTDDEQRLHRSDNHYIAFNGKTKTITQWSHDLNGCSGLVNGRLRRGWSIEKALSTPVRKTKRATCSERSSNVVPATAPT